MYNMRTCVLYEETKVALITLYHSMLYDIVQNETGACLSLSDLFSPPKCHHAQIRTHLNDLMSAISDLHWHLSNSWL